ncbi:glycyl-tRNA synthetase beta chain [Weissella uvarum]|uniref:glycine--tRNA ligase subunit beta n=1 Tax=Weissella uvarum TaxID=1479233 RepID=UPI0019604173|nr:glycine--tRNA ligase subunit beta [Weissella uvarum]MBM7618094.1 glycyl-tRNA synthetase beta chain [Weissella uvarum]MCM0595919.1 glycine--tRNA ligase subunit beta [Weissella uvarum]
MANYLLEIGLEEVPAHLVTPAVEQLVQRMDDFLNDHRLQHGAIKPYSTPRRLSVLVEDIAEKADDLQEEKKGPAKKAALDADGNFTKAAQGFARGQGLTTDDITFKEFNGNEYVYVTKFEEGQPASEVLKGVHEVVENMTFPTTMRWGRHTFEYVRPIRWMVSLLDDTVVPFNVLDVTAGRTSRGHRFLGHDVEIANATDYVDTLASVYVQADAQARKNAIKDQISAIASQNGWQVVPDEDLLEEVNNLVEYPTAFAGNFDEKYLSLPDEVLITSMKEHQRFFHVTNQDGQLLPHFISVRNGNDQHLDNVIAGNEKVLVARLEDAMFFYEEDQKHDIDYYNDKLKHVSFHAKLGSVYDHTRRAKAIAHLIADKLKFNNDQQALLDRAGSIYKFDLMTGMIGEFDELQGVMGEKYALIFGENPQVAQAIREHYMPISAGGELPASDLGKVLALADKLDTMLSFFAAGMIPSGSNDPYALRRAASGVVAILADNDWNLDIDAILNEFIAQMAAHNDTLGLPDVVAANLTGSVASVVDFLTDRVVKEMQDQGIRHDVINAVTQNNFTSTTQMFKSAKALLAHQNDADFRDGVEGLTRIMRLTTKNQTNAVVDPKLFENDAEKALYEASQPIADLQDTDDVLSALLNLAPQIDAYFDQTMVMVEDDAIKQNRIATLQGVAQQAERVANFMELDVKSN